jgi:hypothetical protein
LVDLPASRRDHFDIPAEPITTDPSSSYRAIENLIAAYAELVDDGDFAGVGTLLSDATFMGGSGSVALPDLALQPIASGRYHDRFERRGGRWRLVERRVRTDLVGDVTRHLRHSAANG